MLVLGQLYEVWVCMVAVVEPPFDDLIGIIPIDWDGGIFRTLVSICFYGAPGEIRTPDLVVRSHAPKMMFQPFIVTFGRN